MNYTKLLIFIVITSFGLIILSRGSALDQPPKLSLEDYAERIISKCSSFSPHAICYDQEIPKLMDPPTRLSMEDAFEVIRIIQEQDLEYSYCHNAGHAIAVKEIRKDPLRWKDTVAACPQGICSNGCIHGSIVEKFKEESFSEREVEKIKEDLKNICKKRDNWDPTRYQKSNCHHALGHLNMYLTSGDVQKAIKLCDELSLTDENHYFKNCYDGIFMQIFQYDDPKALALVKASRPLKDQVLSFCNEYPQKVRGSCINESWSLYKEEIITPAKFVEFCSRSKDSEEKRRCYHRTIGQIATMLVIKDAGRTDGIKDFCLSLDKDNIKSCFASSAVRMVRNEIENIKKAIEICQRGEKELSDYCFSELSTYAKRITNIGSDEFENYCSFLPNPWNERCLEGN